MVFVFHFFIFFFISYPNVLLICAIAISVEHLTLTLFFGLLYIKGFIDHATFVFEASHAEMDIPRSHAVRELVPQSCHLIFRPGTAAALSAGSASAIEGEQAAATYPVALPLFPDCVQALCNGHVVRPQELLVQALELSGFQRDMCKYALQRSQNEIHEAHEVCLRVIDQASEVSETVTQEEVMELLTPVKHRSAHRNKTLEELRDMNSRCEASNMVLAGNRMPFVNARDLKVQRGRSAFERLRKKRHRKGSKSAQSSGAGAGESAGAGADSTLVAAGGTDGAGTAGDGAAALFGDVDEACGGNSSGADAGTFEQDCGSDLCEQIGTCICLLAESCADNRGFAADLAVDGGHDGGAAAAQEECESQQLGGAGAFSSSRSRKMMIPPVMLFVDPNAEVAADVAAEVAADVAADVGRMAVTRTTLVGVGGCVRPQLCAEIGDCVCHLRSPQPRQLCDDLAGAGGDPGTSQCTAAPLQPTATPSPSPTTDATAAAAALELALTNKIAHTVAATAKATAAAAEEHCQPRKQEQEHAREKGHALVESNAPPASAGVFNAPAAVRYIDACSDGSGGSGGESDSDNEGAGNTSPRFSFPAPPLPPSPPSPPSAAPLEKGTATPPNVLRKDARATAVSSAPTPQSPDMTAPPIPPTSVSTTLPVQTLGRLHLQSS